MFTMSERGKRLGAVCLSALLTVGLLLMQAPEGVAEECRDTGPYVLFAEDRDWEAVFSPGEQYPRINLEDGAMMDALTAGKIRAIIRAAAAPVPDLYALQTAANAQLAEGELPVENLAEEEVLAAAGEALRHVLGSGAGARLGNNAAVLSRYLCSLPPVEHNTLVVSDNSLHIRSAVAERQPDGTYRTAVEFTTTATWSPGDTMTVTVFCDKESSGFPLTGENMDDLHRAVFSSEMCPEEVRVEINGYQKGEGVFLFASFGENRLMVGWDDRVLPVHGEAAACVVGDLILNIRMEPSRETPVELEVYQVAELWELLSGVVSPGAGELGGYKTDESHVTTLTTDDSGCASFNLTSCGYEEGLYLISGKNGATEDICVCIPAPQADGEGLRYTVTVEPVAEPLGYEYMYLIWWVALICGLLTGTAVAAALLLRLRRV